jgi:hypothetical protein
MSRVRVSIDCLVLRGFEPEDRKPLVEAFERELGRVLADPGARSAWTQPARKRVLRLGSIPWNPGPAGSRKLATGIAQAVGKSVKV